MEIGKKICYTEDENKLARWCMALTSKTEEEFKKSLEGGLMEKETKEKLVEEVNKYSRDEEVIALYTKYTKEEIERNTMIDDAHNEGYKNGFEQGVKKNKLEIAKNMIKENIDIDIISKITGLTKEEIEKL